MNFTARLTEADSADHWYDDDVCKHSKGKTSIMTNPVDQADLRAGALSARIIGGDLRRLCVGQTEVLRAITYPVRDTSWGTYPVRTTARTVTDSSFSRSFTAVTGAFDGQFTVILSAHDDGQATVLAELTLTLRTRNLRSGCDIT